MSLGLFIIYILISSLSAVALSVSDIKSSKESSKSLDRVKEAEQKKIPPIVQIKTSKKKLMSRKMGLTSKITHKRLERAYSYVRREQYNPAIEIFVELLKSTQDRVEENAQIWQQLGFTLAQKGDYQKAIAALNKALDLDVLPYVQTLSSLYTLAQIQNAQENYSKAYKNMSLWFHYADDPSAEAYILMGNLLAQLDYKELALKYVNQALIEAKNPQEKWLQFALALNHELNQHENALKILAVLTATFPNNPKYWKQLTSTYLSLNEDKKALATMELAYKQGFLVEEADLLNLVSLYVYLDMPQAAVETLENEMKNLRISDSAKNLELLSQAYYQSRDRANSMVALNRAAQKSANGDYFARIGMMHLEGEEWTSAVDAFSRSLVKGVKTPAKAYWGLAVAKYQQKDLPGALNTLLKARAQSIEDKNVEQLIDQVKNELVLVSRNELVKINQ